MAKKVTAIPARVNKISKQPIAQIQKRRVAGYARVSTDHDEQFTSCEAQIDYYTNYIHSRDDWEFVKVYTDEGITGTSTKHREGFKEMIADALDGKIDLIVTKSVSRFARNTVDSLTTIRELKENMVEVYFEKENIWTFDGKGELLLTIMSSLAQEESRSISENCTWGQRKRFADGKVSVPYTRFLGYDKGPDGNLVINEEQAVIVRRIFSMFLQGMSCYKIAKILTDEGVTTPGGKKVWGRTVVMSILRNEKYKGDALLQKKFTVDFLTKKQKVNEGEVPQYYVEGNHEAIIDPDTFDMVQREFEKLSNYKGYRSSTYIYSGKIKCGCCGGWFGSKVWHSNSRWKKVVWQCNNKFKNDEKCTTPHLADKDIQDAFIQAANKLLSNKSSVIEDAREMIALILDTSVLEAEQAQLMEETQTLADAINNAIHENATIAQDQNIYEKHYNSLVDKFDEANKKLDEVNEKISSLKSQKFSIESFIKEFQETPNSITEFSNDLWNSLVDYVTVYTEEDIRFTFKNGQEIQA